LVWEGAVGRSWKQFGEKRKVKVVRSDREEDRRACRDRVVMVEEVEDTVEASVDVPVDVGDWNDHVGPFRC
jgi:heme-binding NEAT domain protein